MTKVRFLLSFSRFFLQLSETDLCINILKQIPRLLVGWWSTFLMDSFVLSFVSQGRSKTGNGVGGKALRGGVGLDTIVIQGHAGEGGVGGGGEGHPPTRTRGQNPALATSSPAHMDCTHLVTNVLLTHVSCHVDTLLSGAG